jgi:hypothetical protein
VQQTPPQPGRDPAGRLSRLERSLIHLHDHLYADSSKYLFKRRIIEVSLLAFALHLTLIFLVHVLHEPLLASAVGTDYLSAIATPFNIILFYEVLTLIGALPASTTRSIANQFEIVSLIFIRDVFRDLGGLGGPNWIREQPHAAIPLLTDMGTGLLMFLLVTIFQNIALRQIQTPRTAHAIAARRRFTDYKKLIAVGLSALLIALAALHLTRVIVHIARDSAAQQPVVIEPIGYFFNDVFTVMIFTDVFVAILSLVLTGRYEMVFRNAGYVISVILIRFALMEQHPWNAILAVFATIFAILVSLIYNYHSRIHFASAHDAAAH